jgi:hypothetical protein
MSPGRLMIAEGEGKTLLLFYIITAYIEVLLAAFVEYAAQDWQ